ncbi:MAG: hypothetical protein ACM3XM_15600 [Mycobacterium leprae]
MSQPESELLLWHPPGRRLSPRIAALARRVQLLGGATAMAEWGPQQPGVRVAYVNDEKHDLWWEFSLWASFRWQAHLQGLTSDSFRRRLRHVATGLNLDPLLDQRVEDLTVAELTRANLAVALLPRPNLLIWEEPLCRLAPDEAEYVADFVRQQVATEGLTVIAVGTRLAEAASLLPRVGKTLIAR